MGFLWRGIGLAALAWAAAWGVAIAGDADARVAILPVRRRPAGPFYLLFTDMLR